MTGILHSSTESRKNFSSVQSFIVEPDSRAQCIAMEENVKEFGLTYFGMTDRRQGELKSFALIYCHSLRCPFPGIVHIIGPEQGFTVCEVKFVSLNLCLSLISSRASPAYAEIRTRQVSDAR